MPKYKVGDVAALFAKPEEPTTKSGTKLQSLFEEFHSKGKISAFQPSQNVTSKQNKKSNSMQEFSEDQRISKKNKKRKLSALTETDAKQMDEQEVIFSKKEKKDNSYTAEDFPRQKKKKLKSFDSKEKGFVEFEKNGFENHFESTATSKLNTSPSMKKTTGFIKKSKRQTFHENVKAKKHEAQAFDDSDESIKEEIQHFIKNISKKSKKMKNSPANFEKDSQKKSCVKETDFIKVPGMQSEEESLSNSLLFIQNEQESKTNSNDDSRPKHQNPAPGFIRKSKNDNPSTNNSFDRVHNKKFKKMPNEESYHKSDTLFKSENKEHVRNDKLFKRKLNSNISVQNSPTKLNGKNEPDFITVSKSKPANEEVSSRTLFVGNLPVNTNRKALRTLFSPFGQIESIRFKGIETNKAKIFNENVSKIKLNANYAADTVPGFIVFTERQSAIEALSLSGTMFKGHHITVDFSLPAGTKKLYDDKRSIFIGNLPFDVKDENVWHAFSECGRIEGVRVVRDRATGIGKGFGYVLFSTVESKENALALEDLEIGGRTIRIKVVGSNKEAQKSKATEVRRDTFKSRAIRFKKKNTNPNSRKSIKKLVKKEKTVHKKKKIASILQKSMK